MKKRKLRRRRLSPAEAGNLLSVVKSLDKGQEKKLELDLRRLKKDLRDV